MGTCSAAYRVLHKHKKDAQALFFTLVSGLLAVRRMGRHKKRSDLTWVAPLFYT